MVPFFWIFFACDWRCSHQNLDRSSLGRVIPLNALKLLYQRTPSPWNWLVAEVTVVGIFVFEKHIKAKECFIPFGAIKDAVIPFIKNKEGTIVRFAVFTENLYYFVRIPKWALN